MAQHRRPRRPVSSESPARRIVIYAFGLIVLIGGGLGLLLGQDDLGRPLGATRTDERASRGETRATATAWPSAELAAPLAPSGSASPSPSTELPKSTAPRPAVKAAPASPKPTTTAAGCTSYTGNRLIACNMLGSFGFATSQMPPLDKLWQRESGWSHTASNPSSGAYGIPQALPGTKMATAGSDWRTNPATQIKWGLGYIKQRYGTPASAWAHSQTYNWY